MKNLPCIVRESIYSIIENFAIITFHLINNFFISI